MHNSLQKETKGIELLILVKTMLTVISQYISPHAEYIASVFF